MNLMDSHIEAGRELPRRERQAFYTAVIEYLYYGEEPSLTGAAKAVFVAIRPTLDNSRARAEAGREGGSRRPKQTTSKPTSKREAKTEANAKQTTSKPTSKRRSYQDSSSSSLSHSHSGEGVQGEGGGAEPPTADAVRAYFAANCLRGDPDEFLDFYAAQGWRRSNGLPVEDWEAQARNWSRKQVDIDAKAPVPPPQPPAEDYDDPEQLARWERELAAMRGGGA